MRAATGKFAIDHLGDEARAVAQLILTVLPAGLDCDGTVFRMPGFYDCRCGDAAIVNVYHGSWDGTESVGQWFSFDAMQDGDDQDIMLMSGILSEAGYHIEQCTREHSAVYHDV